MDAFDYDTIAPVINDYIGDELTFEDLKKGFSAFLEDERSESIALVAVETR